MFQQKTQNNSLFTIDLATASARPATGTPRLRIAPETGASSNNRLSAALTTNSSSSAAASSGTNQKIPANQLGVFIGGKENTMVAWLWEEICNGSLPEFTGMLLPLCLYGPSGVGKSSLAQKFASTLASQLSSKSQYAGKGLLCFSGKDFCRSFRQAEETNQVTRWRSVFEEKPVLYIDDVQQIEGHARADKELKEILDQRGSLQLPTIITSHQSPGLLKVSPTLVSRLAGGLALEIKRPQQETQKEIVGRIFANHKIDISGSDASQLGRVYNQNIFAVNQVALRWKLEGGGSRFSLNAAPDSLKQIVSGGATNQPTAADFLKQTASYFDLKIKDLKGSSRRHGCVKARSIAMWICRNHLDLSYSKIGTLFGGRDHSTVISACKKVQKAIDDGQRVTLCCVEHVLKSV